MGKVGTALGHLTRQNCGRGASPAATLPRRPLSCLLLPLDTAALISLIYLAVYGPRGLPSTSKLAGSNLHQTVPHCVLCLPGLALLLSKAKEPSSTGEV